MFIAKLRACYVFRLVHV